MTENELNEIREREAKATPGPWYVNRIYPVDGIGTSRYVESESRTICSTGKRPHDVEFIAHAREDIPRLLAELDAANRRIAELERQVQQ